MDALTGACAAAAKDMEQANVFIIPFQLIFPLFNGLTLTKLNAPEFLKFLLYVLPMSLGLEGIADELYGDDPEIWDELETLYGFDRGNMWLGFVVCGSMTVVGRFGQILAMRHMHNIAK